MKLKFLERFKSYYAKNEKKANIIFFLAGVGLDILTVSEIDDTLTIIQQVCYLFVAGLFLYFDFLSRQSGGIKVHKFFKKIWNYRDPAIHFLMGGLLSIYSIFFVKSASIFSSFAFLLFMISLMIINELKFFKTNKINFKIALYLICVFSFFSMIFPVLVGSVGWLPFGLAMVATLCFLWILYRMLLKQVQSAKVLRASLIYPGIVVLAVFGGFYYLGWIPPVPLSAQEIGVYHNVEKKDNDYFLYREAPLWKFWWHGDQNFIAESGDKLFVFVRVFSPARFDDQVVLHWMLWEERSKKWMTTDKIPMRVRGGRKSGYRGYASKQNYQAGDYRVLIETRDGREIGRLGFNVSMAEQNNPYRYFFSLKR